MSQKSSPLWAYFDVSATDNSKAKCKLCPTLVSRGNVNPSKMTTKNLNYHLKKDHPVEFKLVEKMRTNKSSNSSISHGSGAESSSSIMEENVKSLRTQQQRTAAFQATIPAWVESQTILPFRSDKAQKIHKSIFEMMMSDCQPFTIVNDPGFLRHHQLLAPNFKVT